MKITAVETLVLDAPLATPWKFSTFSVRSLPATLVRLRTDEGVDGVGEAFTRLGGDAIAEIVHGALAPAVLGRDPNDVEAIWEAMYATMRPRGHTRGYLLEALSGVDIALWDVLGKAAGKPVWQLLAGHGRRTIEAYASSVMINTPEVMARDAAALAARGYRGIKIKLGEGVRVDIPRLEAVRAAVGSEVELMVDVNAGYDSAAAIAFGRAAERLGVFWLEEPCFAEDLTGYARVRDALKDVRLAAGEGEFTSGGFRPFLEGGLLDVLQPDIARAGGFTGCRRIAALADAYGVAYAPHTGLSGPVCIAASIHLAAAIPGFLTFEHMIIDNPLTAVLAAPPPQARDGRIEVPTDPGLGITFDEAVLSSFDRSRAGWRSTVSS
ncbi:MAG TPA: mandelate racemase/muconate lactonizing enzyme family protein [Roseomonas sp.]|jgi:L-alanine-DL-glutamate epimerase-like enolase superfamily enzyme